jgi:F-type H+-transporting ATPase subunit b
MNIVSVMAAAEATAETSEGIGALGLSLPAIIASAITFLVLFLVVKKYALSGIVANLEKRENDINRGLHLTAQMDKKAAELEATVEKTLKAARADADAIISEAKVETGKMIQEAEEKANSKADEILRAAEGKIENDIAAARAGLKTEMAGLITDATEAILSQKLDATNDRKLVENYLKEAMK